MKIEWDCVRGMCLVFGPGLIVLAIILATRAYAAPDHFVQMIEARFGQQIGRPFTPGTTVTLMDCQCTVRYVGTAVHGRRYTVVIDRLD